MSTILDVLRRTKESYNELSAAVAALPESMLTTPDVIGTWSVRDVS